MDNHIMIEQIVTRRRSIKLGLGSLGLGLGGYLAARARGGESRATSAGFGRAKSCIVFFCWGGMSQLETFDPKPEAPGDVRGSYKPIPTAVPGIFFGEFVPEFAKQAQRLAVVRSVHHQAAGHRNAAYWSLTGRRPAVEIANDEPIAPSRNDHPCLGSTVARFRSAPQGFPRFVASPHPLADRGILNGQFAGFLGARYEPFIVAPKASRKYAGVSPNAGIADLALPVDVDPARMRRRFELLGRCEDEAWKRESGSLDAFRASAADLLLNPAVANAFNVDGEPAKSRDRYGDHICGRSTLLARRLTEAGVPIVVIYPGSGDLNGSAGDVWDTHGDNFRRLKDNLLPPLEIASSALLDDLADRRLLDQTLVVWLTEFGRTPKINGAQGRDHFPFCYSVAFAGGGTRGGIVWGRSDKIASTPAESPVDPADIHATILHALGIPADSIVHDSLGRPLAACEGEVLPIF